MRNAQQKLGISNLVRKRGFEPRWYYYRQPLKLVRLPVPPLPRGIAWRVVDYFAGAAGVAGAGAGAGTTGAGFAVAGGGAGVPLTTELPPRCPSTDNVSANNMNSTAAIDVAFVKSVAPERAPNAA